MKVRVVGIKDIDYTNKKGNNIRGQELHGLYTDHRVQGYAVDKFYVPQSKAIHIDLNDMIEIYFNRYGSLDEIKLVKE